MAKNPKMIFFIDQQIAQLYLLRCKNTIYFRDVQNLLELITKKASTGSAVDAIIVIISI